MRRYYGENARIVDAVMTLPGVNKGPQELHFDVASGSLLKLAFSITQQPLMTEFGESRRPMTAPTALFDGVRCYSQTPAMRLETFFPPSSSAVPVQGHHKHGAPAAETPPRSDKVFLCIANPLDDSYRSLSSEDGWSTVLNLTRTTQKISVALLP